MAKVEATADIPENVAKRMRDAVEAFAVDMAKLDITGCFDCAIRAGSTFDPVESEGGDLVALRWGFDREKAEAAFRGEHDLRVENERLRQLLDLDPANRKLQEQIWGLEDAAKAMASDAPVVPLPEGERRIEVRDGALYLGLWSRGGVVHWVKAEGVRLDSPDGEFSEDADSELLAEVKQLRQDVGQLLGIVRRQRAEQER
ncbi:hypothetical protein [Limimaricola sp.]|uniref:hypothetical protein n=1 Tax=Limimaricola sp. TaxID=2211665 RepID=UPI004058825B